MQVSHSRIETFKQCQFKYKLKYVDGLKTYPNYEADNPLIIGTALHTGIEQNVNTAIESYYNYYPVITDKHVEEAIKLETIIPRCKAMLPSGIYEQKILSSDFIGFIDLLAPVANGVYDLYDFKYSNNTKNYLESGQLHEYKYFFEKTTGKKIRDLYFLFAPKVAIRMKKTETVEDFRRRLKNEIKDKQPQLVKVDYDFEKVKAFLQSKYDCENETNYAKTPTRLCSFCEYQDFCVSNNDFEIDWRLTNYKDLKDYESKHK